MLSRRELPSLETALAGGRNSLNAVRLALAALVIVSHAPLVAGVGPPYAWGDLEVGGWAVAGFFGISGWLITLSRTRQGPGPFLWRRVLRIYPGFWVVLALTALVLAPLSTLLDEGRWRADQAAEYVVANASLRLLEPRIEGTLPDTGTANWNLSLWTLSWEMACYLGIAALLCWRIARDRRWPVVTVFLVVYVVNAATQLTGADLPAAADAGLRLTAFFLAGAALQRIGDRVPVHPVLAAGAVAALGICWTTHTVTAFGAVPLAYLALFLGATLPLTRVGARNDISYGVYLYGFPMAQLLALVGAADHGMPLYIALTMAGVVPLAAASWFLVEKPALRAKNWWPSARPPRVAAR